MTGKIKSTIFDKKEQTVIIRKRTISCHCRTITAYDLKALRDVRAVWRGLKAGEIDNRHYAIVLEFDQNENTNEVSTQDDEVSSGSDNDPFQTTITPQMEKRIRIQQKFD